MKRKTAFVFSAFFGIAIMTMACSRSANENAGNRRAANVTSETPTPSSTPTPTPENQSEHIRKLLDDFSGALTRGDVDALGNIYSDGFLLISDHGEIITKPDRIMMIKTGDLRYEKVNFEEVSIRPYGDSAVIVAKVIAAATIKGKAQNLEDRVTIVATREGDAWRFVSAQMTKIIDEPSSGNAKNANSSNANSSANSTTKGPANGRF